MSPSPASADEDDSPSAGCLPVVLLFGPRLIPASTRFFLGFFCTRPIGPSTLKLEGGGRLPVEKTKFEAASAGMRTYSWDPGSEASGGVGEGRSGGSDTEDVDATRMGGLADVDGCEEPSPSGGYCRPCVVVGGGCAGCV